VRLGEKLLIQTFSEVFQQQVILMAETCLMAVVVYGILSYQAKPYSDNRQNRINVISSFTGNISTLR
jgi:hypothetical protein